MSAVQAQATEAPPQTPEEVAAIEQRWLETVYKGHTLPELTLQVVVISVLLGALMIAFNIYMGLKTGWGEGGSIIAVILGFAAMRSLGRKYSILENNATQTFASAAGSLGNIVNVIPALILLAEAGIIERGPTFVEVLAWVFFTSFLGVFFAIPLRRQMLVIDQLTFPTGTAAAQTIQAMHAKGSEAVSKARALGLMGMVSGVLTWLQQGPGAFLPHALTPPAAIKGLGGISLANLTVGAAFSPMMVGAGFLVGPRVGTSLLLGGGIAFGILAPWVIDAGIAQQIAENLIRPEYAADCKAAFAGSKEMADELFRSQCKALWQLKNESYYSLVVKWTMWPGLGIMVAAGLTATAMKGKIILSALASLFKPSSAGKSPIAHLEFPTWGWVTGLVVSSIGVCGMLQFSFGVPWYFGLLSVLLSFLLAVIAVRATGETDINPVGAMGSVTQIAFGTLQGLQTGAAEMTGAITKGNLLTGGVAAGGASEAADMMQDLKTGWLVGATPRKQVYAQLMGVFVGSFFCAGIFFVLTAKQPIGSEYWPAPAAVTWSGLAQMMAQGASALPAFALPGLVAGIAIGVLIPVLEKIADPRVKAWLPSAIGLGVAMVVPYIYSVTIFFGSMALLLIQRRNPAWVAAFAGAIGAGGIAGEGLAGVLAAGVGLLAG
jgi:OPT family oligopeptide transporter